MTGLNTGINNASDTPTGVISDYLDYVVLFHGVGVGESRHSSSGITSYDEGVIALSSGVIGSSSPGNSFLSRIKASTMITELANSRLGAGAVPTEGQLINDAYNDGSFIYTVGAFTDPLVSQLMKFNLDGTFSAGLQWTSSNPSELHKVWSDGTNIFVGGINTTGSSKSYLAKLDTSLAIVDDFTGIVGSTGFTAMTGDASNIYFARSDVISSFSKATLTINDDKTLDVPAATNANINGIVVDGANLILVGEAGGFAYIASVSSDLTTVNAGFKQNTGAAIKFKGIVKHNGNYIVCGSNAGDNQGFVAEFDSSLTLLNLKRFISVGSIDFTGITVFEGDIYIAVTATGWTSLSRNSAVLRIKNGQLKAGTFSNGSNQFSDFAATFAASTPTLTAVASDITGAGVFTTSASSPTAGYNVGGIIQIN